MPVLGYEVKNGILKETHKNDAVDLLKEYIKKTGRSQAEIASQLRFSPATINQYLKRIYKGDTSKIDRAVLEFLQRERKRKLGPRPASFVLTRQAKEVLSVLRITHIYKTIGIIYGEAGLGKTMSIQQYLAENLNAILITCDPSMNTNRSLIEEILEALGKAPSRLRNTRELVKQIIDMLKGSDTLLIFDEAHHLKYKQLEILRKIHDIAKIGIALVGTSEVYEQMIGRDEIQFAQLFSRVGIKRNLTAEIYREDVEEIVKSITDNPSKEIIDYLHIRANRKGGLRLMTATLNMASLIAKETTSSLSLDVIKEAEKFMMV
jgi:hypothetical protein